MNRFLNRRRTAVLGLILVALLTTAGACDASNTETLNEDRAAAAEQLRRYQRSQPVPSYDWSQLRQNAIEIMDFQVEGGLSTAFFFNLGVTDPISWCPSIGDPIPTTAQLTNPEQHIKVRDADDGVIPQIEQSGVYTGESTGTNVMCLDAEGEAYKVLWEGFVMSISAPAVWEDGRVRLTGPSDFNFSESR